MIYSSTIIHSIQEGRDRPRLEVDHGDDLAVLHRGEAHAREDAAGVVRVERRLPSSLFLSNLNTCCLKWTPEAALQGTHPTHIGPSPEPFPTDRTYNRLPQTCSKQAAYRLH
jgi:hypothetical protein